ncbi:MAG TPA: tRNA lysidine(34) synthetase TilS [Candidatus Competibacteraceae bacterium]|nr:tRNA lysidine(34) synthetase TilS [Candidatus Competibacteraceae bacterium]
MTSFLDALQTLLTRHPEVRRLWVAYSGGVDSHALLHLLAQHRHELTGRELRAVHVHHGLQAAADAWVEHCTAVCSQLGVALTVRYVDARPLPGASPEAVARQARYGALRGLLEPGDALLTAHHQDDQAETVLLALLRGAGPAGLAAMPEVAPLGAGLLLRPLLGVRRAAILDYARRHGLTWVDDPSNASLHLDRNRLRHEILPRLRQRWPEAGATLARSARLCAEAAAALEELAAADLAGIAGAAPDSLPIPALLALSAPRRRNLLRHWLKTRGLPPPSEAQLQRLLCDALESPRDREPLIHWPGAEVRRYRDRLYASAPLPPHDPGRRWSWSDPRQPLLLPGLGRLCLEPVVGQGLSVRRLAGRALSVAFRQGGERFRPVGRAHGQELKKLLQEAAIPPWQRERLPLLWADGELVWVSGLGPAAGWTAAAGEAGWLAAWQKESPSGNF